MESEQETEMIGGQEVTGDSGSRGGCNLAGKVSYRLRGVQRADTLLTEVIPASPATWKIFEGDVNWDS